MCGIHATISATTCDAGCISEELRRRLDGRGPDHFGQAITHTGGHATCSDRQLRPCLSSTVLALRGDGITQQPFLEESAGSILCWNGEAWAIDDRQVVGNDGQAVFGRLTSGNHLPREDGTAILDVLRSIDGPFAFIYLDKPSDRLYFGRDRLGRRSLLIQLARDDKTHQPQITLSSVSEQQDPRWKEVEANGIYSIDLTQSAFFETSGSDIQITHHSWLPQGADDSSIVLGIGPFNLSVNPPPGSGLHADSPSVQGLVECLEASLRPRVLDVPIPPAAKAGDEDTRIAVLFSGGLDCTVLARLCHELVPSQQGIDLINVAFENPRVVSHLDSGIADFYEACPDRMTGRSSFAELCRVCPSRAWRFLAVNVPYTETVSHRPHIISIMHPHNTEMDLSIASALYFAARGTGCCNSEQNSTQPSLVSTPARVLLSGLGADELFGGYGRHQIAFSRQGYAGLADELRLDVARLGQRNLGRDDRVMAHWSKEVRFPFLDEKLVRWAMGLPSWEKCDFANTADGPDGSGVEAAKRVLRLAALSLGMEGVAREKKRAIQFGARTAKMESGRVKGTATVG